MVCRHGVIKTYKLTYESTEIMHALFDKNAAKNRWTISASVLRSFSEHFGPKTEQLDIYSEEGRAMFTSYTEKIMDGKEILKQPLQTSVAIDTLDFDDFAVEDRLHIGISVKDFRAIVTHADTLNASITASYSHPTRPLQLAYKEKGMQCEFTLMTIGDYREGSVTPAPATNREISIRPAERPASVQRPSPARPRSVAEVMPPPIEPASRSFTRESVTQRPRRPSPPPPQASLDPESLFLPAGDDDDRQWDEKNYNEDEEDTLGWDASAEHVSVGLA
ncbi:dna repair protein rad9 [Lasallia pustulata]|uniref:Dna repair protein rad9 n=1 Tax=Lasallia pustulata TaxID=136370 RepID=A0A1W5CXB7_9LECA|nr:dna repair protein rad9 [Lasallia pustulata]